MGILEKNRSVRGQAAVAAVQVIQVLTVVSHHQKDALLTNILRRSHLYCVIELKIVCLDLVQYP